MGEGKPSLTAQTLGPSLTRFTNEQVTEGDEIVHSSTEPTCGSGTTWTVLSFLGTCGSSLMVSESIYNINAGPQRN